MATTVVSKIVTMQEIQQLTVPHVIKHLACPHRFYEHAALADVRVKINEKKP